MNFKIFFNTYLFNVLKSPFLSFPNLKSVPITKYFICSLLIRISIIKSSADNFDKLLLKRTL